MVHRPSPDYWVESIDEFFLCPGFCRFDDTTYLALRQFQWVRHWITPKSFMVIAEDLFRSALHLTAPWTISSIQFGEGERKLEIWIDFLKRFQISTS